LIAKAVEAVIVGAAIEGEADAMEVTPAPGAAARGAMDGTTKDGNKMVGLIKGGIGG